MKIKNYIIGTAAVIGSLTVFSCNKAEDKAGSLDASSTQSSVQDKISENGTNPDEAIFTNPALASHAGHLYLESNKRDQNTILIFGQRKDGSLIFSDEINSGGYGMGEALGSQGALAISEDYHLLFAVNAGSNSVSSFSINDNGNLKLLSTVTTLGQLPNSVTVYGNLMYVLNTSSSTICGFSFTPDGGSTALDGSTHGLSALNVDAAEVKFRPDGSALYVTEKATNIIDVFELDSKGAITLAVYNPSNGVTPFGFDFARDQQYLVVTNAAAGFDGVGSCTSYKDDGSGNLSAINGAVSNFEFFPCWLATTKNGSLAFVANTTTNNISSYYIDKSGALTLVNAVAASSGKAA